LNSNVVLPNPFLKRRLNRQTHAAIEDRRGQTAMYGTPWIEVSPCWRERDDDAALFGLDDIVAQRLRDGIQWQRPTGEALNELQPAHCPLLFGAYRPVSPGPHDRPPFRQDFRRHPAIAGLRGHGIATS
jgi:hypothetical protein